MNRVRVIRILEYEGPEDWVKATLDKSVVRGKWELSPGRSIRETVGPMIPVPEGEAEPPGGRRGPVVADPQSVVPSRQTRNPRNRGRKVGK
jgi:hypothetical protein